MPGRVRTPRIVRPKAKSSEQSSTPRTITLPRLNIVYLLMTVIVIGAFILGFVLGMLITKISYLEKGVSTTNTTGNTTAAADVTDPVDVSSGALPVQGDNNAKVTIVEFADFQCPFCEQWFKQVEPSIIKDYVNTGKAKFAFRHYAFLGQESTDAANASECANDQGKFWEYHDYLYSHQGSENSGTFSKEHLKEFGATLGLDTATFNDCVDNDSDKSKVDKDISDAGTIGVSGTPTTFVDGMMFSGACPYNSFKQAIDLTLAGKKYKILGTDGCTVQAL